MNIDSVAMLQGISDARDANEISDVLYTELCRRIDKISRCGETGRKECYYGDLLNELSLMIFAGRLDEIPNVEYARMWRLLGVSLADGIMVAN